MFSSYINEQNLYGLTVKRRKCFNLFVGQVRHGIWFRAVTLTLRELQTSAALSFMEYVSEADVSMYVQVVAVMSLSRFSMLLSNSFSWAFSIAFEGGIILASTYIDLRVRFYDNNPLLNYHVFSISNYELHTAKNIYFMISKLLSRLCGDFWKKTLIGVATDDASNMVIWCSSDTSKRLLR